MTKHITPRYKLMLFYDLSPGSSEAYYEFLMQEMVPAVQDMGLYMFRVFHTVWGDCPLRQAEFVAEDLVTVQAILASEEWQALEQKLMSYATNYHRKLVRFRPGFQM